MVGEKGQRNRGSRCKGRGGLTVILNYISKVEKRVLTRCIVCPVEICPV